MIIWIVRLVVDMGRVWLKFCCINNDICVLCDIGIVFIVNK